MADRTILLVEDEADILEVARTTLELTTDWVVHTATSGARGLERAAELQPDVIILDVMMPDMDGPETLSRLRQQESTREIPVIFMTAKTNSLDRGRFEAAGVKGVIPKPFDPMILGDQIAEILDWKGRA